MKEKIVDLHKTEKGSKELPTQFNEPLREDLIQRAVMAIQSTEHQAHGVYPRAGHRWSTDVSHRRRDFKTAYGHGLSRVPRKVLSRSGTQFNWVGAQMPGTVGGRIAHPSKAQKDWVQKINTKERRKAICSAISATMHPELIKKRGHRIPQGFPFILDNKIESLHKTSDVTEALERLGFSEELARTSDVNIRAGKGKNRARPHQTKTGPLFVVSKDCPLLHAGKNIAGVDVVTVHGLNASLLAPGTHAGRLTLWSEAAIDVLANEKLFTLNYQGPKQVVAVKEVKPVKKTAIKQKAKGKA